MLRDFGDRENSRVRDLADLMLLLDAGLLTSGRLARTVTAVWAERDSAAPPATFPDLPAELAERYEQLAAENDIEPASFSAAAARAASLWAEMFPTKEG